jgi:DNA repair protein RAD7
MKKKGKKRGGDEDSDSNAAFSDDSDFKATMYRKAKPAPGQFDNCEICEKRFTVTPYSKTGPDGGLLCSPCGKAIEKDASSGKPAAAKNNPAGKRRRKVESERMDGVVRVGAKPLVQHCIETAVKYHDEIDSLDNMPDHLIEKISQLFAKHRVMNSTTLPLFLRADKNVMKVFDCACK